MRDWNDLDRELVAVSLLKEFPQLSLDALLDAVRECEIGLKREEGRARLLSSTREYLVEKFGTAKRPP